jgi:integrase
MAISKRTTKDGKTSYTVQVMIPNPAGGRGERVTIGTFRTRKLAESAEQKEQDKIASGMFIPPKLRVPPKVTTVADALDVWFQTKRGSVTTNTATIYESAIRLHLIPALGDRDVTKLTHDDVQRQVNAWRDGEMGARLLARCVTILHAALDRQVKNGTIPFNPTNGVEKPSARTRKELPIWTRGQIDAFLTEAAQDQYHAPFWFFCLAEGMRRGEALGLRWRDLHWGKDDETCTAVISQTIVPDLANGGAARIQQRAKTKGSQRSVVLTGATVAVLKAHRDRQRFHRQRLADVWGDHDLICTTSIGTPINPSSIKRDLKGLVKAAKVPEVTTHGLRHIAATVMLRAGVSPALAALKLGHSDIGNTVDRYGHLAVEDQAAANAALEAVMRRSGTEG